MTEKKLTPLMHIHLGLMVLLDIMSGVVIVSLLIGTLISGSMIPAPYRTSMILTILLNLVNVIALSAGITYILERYGKRAASAYKAFMLLTAISCVFYAITGTSRMNAAELSIGAASVFLRAVLPMAFKLILLLVLAFGKDLGKRNTWIVFGVILVLDVIYSVLWIIPGEQTLVRIVMVFARLAMTGTIGLSIKGKYDDKDARGTK